MAEQGVRIEVDLGVQRHHAAVARERQRVDLGQAGVGVPERPVQRLEHGARLRHRCGGNADFRRDLVGLGVLQPGFRIDEYFVDFLRRVRCDFLDVHAALARGHQAHLLRDPVHHHADVEFALDVGALFDQEAPHFLPLGAGLVRLQLHAENLAGAGFHLVR